MNIIYYCFAGAHASVVAAGIHCGLLPADKIPSYDQFLALPYYDRTAPRLIGTPYFMGMDEYGHRVFFMGMWNQRIVLSGAIRQLLTISGIQDREYILQDAFPLITFSTKFGGALSKRFCLTYLGRRLSVWGIQRRYGEFIDLVKGVKSRLG